jgi:NADH-quinone oxidoreductase subunit J
VSPFLTDTLFALAAVAVLGFSLSVVFAKNPVRATLLLILSFLPVSLIYIMLQATFAGILQILVYAGAILMLFTFVIMMINPAPHEGEVPEGAGFESPSRKGTLTWLLLLAGVGLVLIPPVHYAASLLETQPVTKEGFGGIHSIAQYLFADPMNNPLTISFELISILILVGVIAAVNFARRRAHVPAGRSDAGTPKEDGR